MLIISKLPGFCSINPLELYSETQQLSPQEGGAHV